ncbi:hypothetical protein [Paenibacillus sp. y28]|uniref:hypothetical protein n=1 Tax=Paenibacillus sp. y28 TaxID=3129110 RepID=UPI0030163126
MEDKDPNYFHVYVYPKRKPNVVSDLDIRFVNGEYVLGSELSLYSIWIDLLESDAEDDYMEKIKAFYPNKRVGLNFQFPSSPDGRKNSKGKYWTYSDYIKKYPYRDGIQPMVDLSRSINPETIEQEYQTLFELLRSLYAEKYYWGVFRVEYINDSNNNSIHKKPIFITPDDLITLHSAKDIEKLLFQPPWRNNVPPVKEQ